MGICSCLLSLLLLFISTTQVMYFAEGKSVFKHPEVAKVGGGEATVSAMTIGSTPPRCEKRCSSCGHCEAVQVPVAPDERSTGIRHFIFRSKSSVTSRSDDTSNYKPMSWKCKCGERILNP